MTKRKWNPTPKQLQTAKQVYREGGNDEEVFNALGISRDLFYRHKKENPEQWQELKSEATAILFKSIRSRLVEKAMEGDITALIFLSKNYLKMNSGDPRMLKIKEEELELKKREMAVREAITSKVLEDDDRLETSMSALELLIRGN